jgi:NCS1 family nucleobase:cation symporter-1
MPGFVAAINTSITVSDAATELYYINYPYGFLVSAAVHAFLYWLIPNWKLHAFVTGDAPASEIQ